MAKATLLILKLLMILICAGWITLWILKPTQLWTKKWHTAEDSARTTVFGYYGMKFSPEISSTEIPLATELSFFFFLSFLLSDYGKNKKGP